MTRHQVIDVQVSRRILWVGAQAYPLHNQVIDNALREIGDGTNVEPGTFRRALIAISGIATVVGQVGAPVVDAVQRVLALAAGS